MDAPAPLARLLDWHAAKQDGTADALAQLQRELEALRAQVLEQQQESEVIKGVRHELRTLREETAAVAEELQRLRSLVEAQQETAAARTAGLERALRSFQDEVAPDLQARAEVQAAMTEQLATLSEQLGAQEELGKRVQKEQQRLRALMDSTSTQLASTREERQDWHSLHRGTSQDLERLRRSVTMLQQGRKEDGKRMGEVERTRTEADAELHQAIAQVRQQSTARFQDLEKDLRRQLAQLQAQLHVQPSRPSTDAATRDLRSPAADSLSASVLDRLERVEAVTESGAREQEALGYSVSMVLRRLEQQEEERAKELRVGSPEKGGRLKAPTRSIATPASKR